MNLKLFQQQCEKKLFIVLRDFNHKQHNFEKIKLTIKNDILNIWKDIKKPDQFANYTPEKFFQIEFTALPHKIYFEEQFDAEVEKLSERFLPDSPYFIFNHSNSSKGVPADGFHKYCSDIWDTIIKEKDLNLV
jgi:protein SEY1